MAATLDLDAVKIEALYSAVGAAVNLVNVKIL
jgi:hypothetical protein